MCCELFKASNGIGLLLPVLCSTHAHNISINDVVVDPTSVFLSYSFHYMITTILIISLSLCRYCFQRPEFWVLDQSLCQYIFLS